MAHRVDDADTGASAVRAVLESTVLAEVDDGGAELRAFAAREGFELVHVESSTTSCTARAARDPIDYRPAVVTVTVDDVARAGLDEHPVYRRDPQRFLAGWATRGAASAVLADVVLHVDYKRQLEPLGVKPPPLTASAAESVQHEREVLTALVAYARRETWRGALRRRPLVAFVRRPLARARARRARRAMLRRAPARSPGPRDPEPPPSPLELEAAA